MAPRSFPIKPDFKTGSERLMYETFMAAMSDDDVIFCNVPISDPQHGDVEIDFVLCLKGIGIMVVEVKGGHISLNHGKWIQADDHGNREIFPASQARKNMYSVRDYLRNRWSQGNLRTDWIVAFPNTDLLGVNTSELPVNKYMDKKDLAFPLSKIKSLLKGQPGVKVPAGNDWITSAVKHLSPISSLDNNSSEVFESNLDYIRDLTHERLTLLNQISENQRYFVHGPAGSGKTWLAFEQAKSWSAEGKKVALIAFNRGLVSYLQNKAAELDMSLAPTFIDTFHQFAIRMGTTAGLPSKYDEENDPYRDALLAAAAAMDEDEKFDAIVVDEAQDFMASWWECLILNLKDPETGFIGAFGDDQQKLNGKRIGPGNSFARFKLDDNIRNSRQIAMLASSLVERSIAVRGPNSYSIDFIVCEESEVIEKADDVVAELTDVERWKPGEIALLTTKKRHPVHVELAEKDRDQYWYDFWNDDEVFYGTVSGFKGLERPVVVLAIDGFHHAEDFDDFLYVGITRARDKLVIVCTNEVKKKFESV